MCNEQLHLWFRKLVENPYSHLLSCGYNELQIPKELCTEQKIVAITKPKAEMQHEMEVSAQVDLLPVMCGVMPKQTELYLLNQQMTEKLGSEKKQTSDFRYS